jgi:hypothetical protein
MSVYDRMTSRERPFGEEFDTRVTDINFRAALAHVQLSQDSHGVYLFCRTDCFARNIDQLMEKIGVPRNKGDVITPGYNYDVMNERLSICGDDAVRAVIAAGYRFPGIEFIAKTLGVAVPSQSSFAERLC